ncbi:hypothetical protein EV363DRAFT_1172848 [Boletus edulis]|nr:hypothetical protein EV363DRAFT_1279953 [Boletus edulis]KAF8127144.1 hypothetical protein EV363DRAFT_1172848 [Boletus edulis]
MSSDKRRKRAAALVARPPRTARPRLFQRTRPPHPASQLTSLGSGAREPDCRADRRSHPPSQLTPHPLLPIHSLSRPSAPSRPPPLVGLAYRAMSKDEPKVYLLTC